MFWAMLENCEQMRNLLLGHLETVKNIGFINAETLSTWLLDRHTYQWSSFFKIMGKKIVLTNEASFVCDIELILRNPASEVENVWGAQIMWNWIGMHARLYWLSQIHFHFLKFTSNYLEITFTFFKFTFTCKKFIFSNWPHFLRRRGADSSGNPTYVQFMPFEHLAWAQNFHQLITLSAVSTKNARSNRFNEMCAISGVESNFQYHLLTSWESNLWWVWMKTSNWVLFPRS